MIYLIATDLGPRPVEGAPFTVDIGTRSARWFIHDLTPGVPALSDIRSGLQVTRLGPWQADRYTLEDAATDFTVFAIEEYGVDHIWAKLDAAAPISNGEEFL